MGRPFPTATYIIPFLAPAFGLFAWAWQNGLALQPFWPHLPWTATLAASGAFLAGLLIQDLYNPRSWLIRLRDRWNHSLEFTHAGVTGDETSERREVRIGVRVIRPFAKADLIVRAYSLTQRASPPQMFVVQALKSAQFAAGETHEFTVATIPVMRPGWQPKGMTWASGENLIGQSNNIIEVELRSALRRDRHRFHLWVTSQQPKEVGQSKLTAPGHVDPFSIKPNPADVIGFR